MNNSDYGRPAKFMDLTVKFLFWENRITTPPHAKPGNPTEISSEVYGYGELDDGRVVSTSFRNIRFL